MVCIRTIFRAQVSLKESFGIDVFSRKDVFLVNVFPLRVYAVVTAVRMCDKTNQSEKRKTDMKANRIVAVVCTVLICGITSYAQKAQDIESVIVSGKDSLWYAQQAEAWEKEVERNPKSELAWRNLFEAKWYLHNWFNVQIPAVTDSSQLVIKRMEKAIPGSFSYNLCMYRMNMRPQCEHGEKALDAVPDELHPKHVETLVSYMWFSGYAETVNNRSELLTQLLQRQYDKSYYPDYALRYSYNQLEAMPKGAIYIGHGDLDLFPKLMMQRVMGVHSDKTIIVNSFLCFRKYADSVCKGLGISPYAGLKDEYADAEEVRKAEAGFIRYIAKQTGRPLYFGAGVSMQIEELANCTYNEGIVYRYSETPYNNIAATKNALENKYHLDYLTEPKFRAETYWKGSEKLQVNYVVSLAHLVKSYRESGDKKRAQWLYDILRASVENTRLADDDKRYYINYLDGNK